jgi:RNA polymerase sigma-70 factor (ECF subfamily)
LSEAPENARLIQLISRIANRESEAVGQLYDLLGAWVFSLALSVVRERPDAEEVTQEVFLRVWQQADRYSSGRGSVRAWLAVITRRLAIDRTRARGYLEKQRTSSFEDDMINLADGASDGGIAGAAEGRLVLDAMKRLENSMMEALHLSYYQGYSHGEIAAKLNLPLGTVKSRIRNGMKQLREMLDIKVKS